MGMVQLLNHRIIVAEKRAFQAVESGWFQFLTGVFGLMNENWRCSRKYQCRKMTWGRRRHELDTFIIGVT
jgi:hypothetical protein